MTDTTDTPDGAQTGADGLDFDGCARECRKPRVHSYRWGYCEHAPESAKPEPRITFGGVRTMADGQPGIALESVTVSELAARIERALHTVPIRLGPKSLELIRGGHEMHLTGGEYAAMALAVALDLAGAPDA